MTAPVPGQLTELARRRRDRVVRTIDKVTARYEAGAPLTRLAKDYGVNTKWLREQLLDQGVEIRGWIAARRLRTEREKRQRGHT
ncbi:hypothetical protein ACFVIM_19560 [Streptomyces sp. NPDC057638]|uniref:hypothetical protein n=1 Tax=Streptomyces sp. NPDC057638 TaxID=3346190 RepID=UPI0036859981